MRRSCWVAGTCPSPRHKASAVEQAQHGAEQKPANGDIRFRPTTRCMAMGIMQAMVSYSFAITLAEQIKED
jgi:hypothetical protein